MRCKLITIAGVLGALLLPSPAAWPADDAQTRPTMIFDNNTRVENDPRREFRQFVIEHRTADFERVRHRHPVHFHQHVSRKLGRRFEIRHL